MLGLIPVLAAAAAFSFQGQTGPAVYAVNVPATLGHQKIAKAEAASGLDVYLPGTFSGVGGAPRKLYPDVDASAGRYVLDLGLTKHCHGGGACFWAYFTGENGGRLYGKRHVKLHKGIRGRFAASHCGANCSAPAIYFKIDGVAYSIAFREGTGFKESRSLANDAIDAGPR